VRSLRVLGADSTCIRRSERRVLPVLAHATTF
jgi:hypothetical protein